VCPCTVLSHSEPAKATDTGTFIPDTNDDAGARSIYGFFRRGIGLAPLTHSANASAETLRSDAPTTIRTASSSDALASCVAQPKTAVFGEERFPTIFDKAAAYCHFIVRLHPFLDGNKRTGLVAAITFLLDHGATPGFDESEMYDAILRIVCGRMEIEELANLFRRNGME